MDTIEFYLRERLKSLGYPGEDLKLGYSLGYCQGDGVAFYGDISVRDIKNIMKRRQQERLHMTPYERVSNLKSGAIQNKLFAYLEEQQIGTLEIRKCNPHYDHWNTMEIVDEVGDGIYTDDMEAIVIDEGLITAEELEVFDKSWLSVIAELDEDLEATSKLLESEAYAIIESGCHEKQEVWRFQTPRFTVSLFEVPDDSLDLIHWGDDSALDTLQTFVKGEQRYLGLEATVIENETGNEIGRYGLYGITLSTEQCRRHHDGFGRDVVAEAIDEARDALTRTGLSMAA